MYRNVEHYADPTVGRAIANAMADMRYQRQKEIREQAAAERKKIRDAERALQKERLAHCQFVCVWEAPAGQSGNGNRYRNRNRRRQ